MISEQTGDLDRCKKIVEKILHSKGIKVSEKAVIEITKDIIGISYAKGGDSSSDMIYAFAEAYMQRGLYEKYLDTEDVQ